MRVLVTGSTGFIGSHVTDNLYRRGIDVLGLDRHSSRHETVITDILHASNVQSACSGVDGVIHLAGILGTGETVNAPWQTMETNYRGALNVFRACALFDIPCSYITVGNDWMFNPYSISKRATESLAWMFNHEYGTWISVTRVLSAYGPGQKTAPIRKIIPTFIAAALAGRPVEVYGDGEQLCDLIHARDVADVLVRALVVPHGQYNARPPTSGPHPYRFDAGTGTGMSVNEVAALVIAEVGSDSPIRHVPMRPGEPEGACVVGNPETLRPLYDGQTPDLIKLADGLRETVKWYRSR